MQTPSLLLKNAIPIYNLDVINFLEEIKAKKKLNEILNSQEIKDTFLLNYFRWLKKSSLIEYKGLEEFKHKSFSHGTIQGFDFFYSKHNNKRFRFFKGEFIYHKLSCRNNFKFKYLEEGELEKGDAVIISLPFSDNGGAHPKMNSVLKKCDKIGIPVLLDLAYINISGDLSVDLNFKCIETLTFSLSKTFSSLERLRVGMRLNREYEDDPMDVFNSINMVNNYGAFIGNELINYFESDYNYNKYHKKQIEICKMHNLKISSCVIFGLGDEKFLDYNRGGAFNRVCISNLLSDKKI